MTKRKTVLTTRTFKIEGVELSEEEIGLRRSLFELFEGEGLHIEYRFVVEAYPTGVMDETGALLPDLDLSSQERELWDLMALNVGEDVSLDRIAIALGFETADNDMQRSRVAVIVFRLRRKLRETQFRILTVRGVGYKLVVE